MYIHQGHEYGVRLADVLGAMRAREEAKVQDGVKVHGCRETRLAPALEEWNVVCVPFCIYLRHKHLLGGVLAC